MRYITVALACLAVITASAAQTTLSPELAVAAKAIFGDQADSPLAISFLSSWEEPIEPTKIVGPIYYVGTRGLGAYLITTPAGHIMLDGGMPQTPQMFEASIRKAGFKPEDIKVLLITHAHVDHAGTVAYFKKLSGAQVAVMDRDVDQLKSGGRTDPASGNESAFYFPPVTADRALKDGDKVSLGNVTMTAHLGAGHTRGATTWTTTVQDGGRSYNVVFPCCTTVLPSYHFGANPTYPGIADDYRRTFSMLESLHPDIWLAAHTQFFGFAQKRARATQEGVSAWLDPNGYRAFVAKDKATFEMRVATEK